MPHLARINHRFYFRFPLPKCLRIDTQKELRLSLYTQDYQAAKTLASTYSLACSKLKQQSLAELGIRNIEGLKAHIRQSAGMNQPNEFVSLIEVTGTTEKPALIAAIKLLLTYNVNFYVLPRQVSAGTVQRLVGDQWVNHAPAHSMKIPQVEVDLDAINREVNSATVDYVIEHNFQWSQDGNQFSITLPEGENQLFKFRQMFIRANVDESLIAKVRTLISPTTIRAQQQGVAAAPLQHSELLADEIEEFIRRKTLNRGDVRQVPWTKKTAGDYQSHLLFFLKMVGNKPILEITNADYDRYIDALVKKKKTNVKKDDPNPSTIAWSTVEKYHDIACHLIKWLEPRYPTMNVSLRTALELLKPKRPLKKNNRKPFTDEHLKTMFAGAGIALLMLEKKPSYVWMPLISLHQACRAEEIASLRLANFGKDGDIHYMDIVEDDDTKRVKTHNSIRRIPIHTTLIDLGLLKYVERLRKLSEKNTQGRLFPELSYSDTHGYKRSSTKFFNERFLIDLGITDGAYRFHSFRHVVSGLLNRSHVQPWRISAFLGHRLKGKDETESIRSYMNDKKLSDLLPCLDEIKYKIDWNEYRKLCDRTYK